MAKGDPKSVTVQYKVHLKPTEIGRLVIERLERPHLDVSPELRRFIELGYAAERAGFSLDGAILRHAGRAWDIRSDVTAVAPSPAVPRPNTSETEQTQATSSVPAGDTQQLELPSATSHDQSSAGEKAVEASDASTSLRANLRGLSG